MVYHGYSQPISAPNAPGWDGFRVFRDLWTFDVDAQRWSLLDTGNSGPSARHDHVAVFDPTKRRAPKIKSNRVSR